MVRLGGWFGLLWVLVMHWFWLGDLVVCDCDYVYFVSGFVGLPVACISSSGFVLGVLRALRGFILLLWFVILGLLWIDWLVSWGCWFTDVG